MTSNDSPRDPNDTKWIDYFIYSKPDGSFKVEEEAIDKGLYKRKAMYITDDMGWFHEVTEKQLNELIADME